MSDEHPASPMRIAVAGASGRMGRMLTEAVRASDKAELAAALEREGHDWIDRDLGEVTGGAPAGIRVISDVEAALAGADALIDFTAPASTVEFSRHAAEAGVAHIIGTTGFSDEDLGALALSLIHI